MINQPSIAGGGLLGMGNQQVLRQGDLTVDHDLGDGFGLHQHLLTGITLRAPREASAH